MVGFVVDVLLEAVDYFDSTDRRRCKQGYAQAWKVCGSEAGGSVDLLRQAFKDANVTRAYTDPDGAIVAPWIAAWRKGLNPRAASRFVRAGPR